MIKCWKSQTDYIRARGRLAELRLQFLAHIGNPESIRDPDNHRHLFIVAMHQARLDMHEARVELEPLHPFYYA